MKKIIFISILLVLSIVLSACGGTTPQNPQPQDTTAADTTSEQPSTPSKDLSAKEYKYVVVIGVDGGGTFFKDTETPNIDKIFEDGSVTYEARTGVPAISAHSWTSLLHGVPYNVHKISNATAEKNPYPLDSEYPSIFRVIRENDPEARLASIHRWKAFNIGMVEDEIGVDKITLENSTDMALAETVCNYVAEGAPKLLFTVFDDADVMGHAYGWGSQQHLNAITAIDECIGMVYEAYENLGILDDTLIMLTADHGGYQGDHGGNMDCEKFIMFAINGSNVIPGGAAEDMIIYDVPSIVMHALGIEVPETWWSRVPAGIFEGFGGGERPMYISESNVRYRESMPTPEEGSDSYISNFITDKNLQYYLTFDETTEDSVGNTIEATDDYYFVDGIFGKGIWLDNGYLTIPNYTTGGDSFTISFWLKQEGLFEESIILANKDRANTTEKGYSFAIHRTEPTIMINIGDGEVAKDRAYLMPSDYRDGWVNVIFTYDAAEGKAKVSYDFGAFKNITLSEGTTGDIFEGDGTLYIGYDHTGRLFNNLNAGLDEFMQFDGAFTEADVAALAAYYAK